MQYVKKIGGAIFHSDRGEVSIPEKHSEPCFGRQGLFKASAVPEIALTIREWKAFCDLEEGKIGHKLTQGQVKSIIFRYIFVYYNRIRISSVNPGGLSPVAYREWAKANAPTVACRYRTAPEFPAFRYAP